MYRIKHSTTYAINVLTLILGTALIFLAGIKIIAGQQSGPVKINEVSNCNVNIIKDSHLNYTDYIELYNLSSESISLDGWYLSDDQKNLKKWRLSDLTVDSGGFLILFANGNDESTDDIPFKINSEGESLFLTDSSGNLTDNVSVPKLDVNTAYARAQDGDGSWVYMKASPGSSNADSGRVPQQILDEPVFSAEGGYYENPFELKLQANSGETIYYTLDGSEPTDNSAVYTDGIWIGEMERRESSYSGIRNVVLNWKNYTPDASPVDHAVIVRAVAMNDQLNQASKIVTQTYFVANDQYKDKEIVSLAADPEDLFGEDGICVTGKEYDDWYLNETDDSDENTEDDSPTANFMQTGRKSEILGNVELLKNGQETLNQLAGIRIQGTSTRKEAKKRFSLFARKEYSGSDFFESGFWGNANTHSVLLRDSFMNALSHRLIEGRDVANQMTSPATVFLNGEYWYDIFLVEKYNKYSISEQFQVDEDNLVYIKDSEVEVGENSYINLLKDFWNYVENTDFSSAEEYEQLNHRADIQSFIDWMCANVYLGNTDINQWHNETLWRTLLEEDSPYGDARWRWMMYDCDCIDWDDPTYYGKERNAQIASLSTAGHFSNLSWEDYPLFAALRENEEFQKQFVLTFMDIANTCFSEENVLEKLNAWGEDLSWHDSFFTERFDYIVSDLAAVFHLEGTLENVTIETNLPEAGTITINTAEADMESGSWTGKYFTDYPITVGAVAKNGYHFAGWEGSSNSSADEILVDVTSEGIHLKAIFTK